MISIIVPVYNIERYIQGCIQSIVDQTYKELEILLVDDGSTDLSGKICDKYAKLDQRIKVIHKENGGVSSARNAGLDIASGQYIGFVDGDDVIMPLMYERLIENMRYSGADIACCGCVRMDISKAETYYKNFKEGMYPTEQRLLNGKEACIELYKTDLKGNIMNSTWNKVYRRELWNDVRFPEGKLCEDIFVIYKMLYSANFVSVYDYPMYLYIRRKGSITNSSIANQLHTLEAQKQNIFFWKENEELELRDFASFDYFMNLPGAYCACTKLGNADQADMLRKEWLAEYTMHNKIVNKRKWLKIQFFRWSPRLYNWLYWKRKVL